MPAGIARATTLIVVLILTLIAARATLAQGDKPDSPSATITLPAAGSTNTPGNAWSVTNTGAGRAGYFAVTSGTNITSALEARSYSTATAAVAISAVMSATRSASNSAALAATNYGAGHGVLARVSGSGTGVYATSNGPGGRGVFGSSKSTSSTVVGYGVYGESYSLRGVGVYGVDISNNQTNGHGYGVYGKTDSPFGAGSYGENISTTTYGYPVGALGSAISSTNGIGVYGKGGLMGVRAEGGTYSVYADGGTYAVYASGATGVLAKSENCSEANCYGVDSSSSGSNIYSYYVGVHGTGTSYGVQGEALGSYGTGVKGLGTDYGVTGEGGAYGMAGYASNSTGIGVYGVNSDSDKGIGVWGNGPHYVGVKGTGSSTGIWGGDLYTGDGVAGEGYGYGVYGTSPQIGIFGKTTGSGAGAYAGWFEGSIVINGHVHSTGILSTRAPSPTDSDKYIQEAAIVSPQQLGQVSGNATLDSRGQSTVTLPSWFSGLYGDLRYVLTPVGDSAALFVAKRVANNQFTIAGGKSGLQVSWLVIGERQDAAAKNDPLQVEISKNDPSLVPQSPDPMIALHAFSPPPTPPASK